MATSRKPTAPTAEAIDRFCGHFDGLFARLAERTALRQYLIGLLLPRERNKTLTELAAVVPGADRQRLHHFLHDAPWDSAAVDARTYQAEIRCAATNIDHQNVIRTVRLVGQSAFEIGRNIVPLQPAVKCGLRLFKQTNGFRKTRLQRSHKSQSLGRGIEGCG